MVTLKRITQAEDEAFRKLTALYTEAFPVEERREIGQLGELLHTEPAMYFNAVECDGQLAGLFVYWDFGSFYSAFQQKQPNVRGNKNFRNPNKQTTRQADRHIPLH